MFLVILATTLVAALGGLVVGRRWVLAPVAALWPVVGIGIGMGWWGGTGFSQDDALSTIVLVFVLLTLLACAGAMAGIVAHRWTFRGRPTSVD